MPKHDEHKDLQPQPPRNIETVHEPSPDVRCLFIDITFFLSLLQSWADAIGARNKRKAVDRLLASEEWIVLYKDAATGCCVYTEKENIDHPHEVSTAHALAAVGYDVLFAPVGIFPRHHKRFDVYLIRKHIILKADLKSIGSKNPDTIAQRIKDGAQQANRLVIDIVSDISTRNLIVGLRSGIVGQKTLIEILLFFRNRFYRLKRQEIMGKNIFKILR